jgi:CheY-like chemotaxis protein
MDILPRGSETVLLVDVDPEPRKLAAFMLQRRGYSVVEARSSADALRICESGLRPDLVITEILLPGMSGPDLVAKLTARQPDLRVLYMSRLEYQRATQRLQVDRDLGFLEKPFTVAVITNKVRRALDAVPSRTVGAGV